MAGVCGTAATQRGGWPGSSVHGILQAGVPEWVARA